MASLIMLSARYRSSQTAHDGLVLCYHHQTVFVTHRLQYGRFIQWIDGRIMQHGHADVVFGQIGATSSITIGTFPRSRRMQTGRHLALI